MLYSSSENKKIKELKKLSQKKYRDKLNMFLVEGEHLVDEAFKIGCLEEVLILEGETCNLDVMVNEVSSSVMRYLSSLDTPSSVMGVCHKPLASGIGDKVLMLDGVQDPGNLGTIIRSAVAFDVDTIIVSDKTADVYSSKVIRASQGMIFKVSLVVCDLHEKLLSLKENGYFVYGTKVTSGKELKTLYKNEKFVIIMGNEGNGVSLDRLNLCDEHLYIPMNGDCESLNVAVATSIILYEISR